MPQLATLLLAALGLLGNLSTTLVRVEPTGVEIHLQPTTTPVTGTARLVSLVAALSGLIVPGATVNRVDVTGAGAVEIRLMLPPA